MTQSSEILIIGGGVTGLTTAWLLAQQGVDVIVVDRQPTGREASWAGAGMLPPGNPATATSPEARLRALSHSLWPHLSSELKSVTGIDTGYQRCGAIEVFADDAHRHRAMEQWLAEEVAVRTVDRSELLSLAPGFSDRFCDAAFLPDFGQVRNPRHLHALRTACLLRGVRILEGVDDLRLQVRSSGVVDVHSDTVRLSADRICVTAGAWTRRLLLPLNIELPVEPVRGQILQLKTDGPPICHVIEQGRRYLVPRNDGLLLVGSTEERVGFAKHTTADGIAQLLAFATSLLPELGRAEVRRVWAGLRPGSPDELPYLGPVAGLENLFVGAGHFRSGLQMSPGTGAILCSLLLDQEPPVCLDGLDADRGQKTLV